MGDSPRVTAVRDMFAAMATGDRAGALAPYAADAAFHVVSVYAPAEVKGVDSYREYAGKAPTEDLHLELGDVQELVGCVVARVGGRYTGEFKGDAEFLPVNLVQVFRFDEADRIVESWVFE